MYEGSALNLSTTFVFSQLISLQNIFKYYWNTIKQHLNAI